MKQVTIPAQWLQELIALCGPEDHELRERVMKSAAPAPADAPDLRATIMGTPLGVFGTGIGDIGIAYRAGHRAALLTAAERVATQAAPADALATATGLPAQADMVHPDHRAIYFIKGWDAHKLAGPDADDAAIRLYMAAIPAAAPQAQAGARDAGRWRMASLIHSEMMKHPDIRAEPEAASAYMNAVHNGVCFEAAIDAAIAAAKEQK